MGDTNSVVGIVKILEVAKKKKVFNNIFFTKFRAQLPQIKKDDKSIISLVLWGNLANDIEKYYRMNDYILIEGYLSVRHFSKINKKKKNPNNSFKSLSVNA